MYYSLIPSTHLYNALKLYDDEDVYTQLFSKKKNILPTLGAIKIANNIPCCVCSSRYDVT